MDCKFVIGQLVKTHLKGKDWSFESAPVRGPADGEIVKVKNLLPEIIINGRSCPVVDGVWLELEGYGSYWSSTSFRPLQEFPKAVEDLKKLLNTKPMPSSLGADNGCGDGG